MLCAPWNIFVKRLRDSPVTKPSMLLDSHWADGIYFETKKYLYRPIGQGLYVCKYYIWYERRMHHGNSCHAVASYYSSETWLRTQNVTAATTRITHSVGKCIQSKLQAAANTKYLRKLVLTVFNTWNSSNTSELREGVGNVTEIKRTLRKSITRKVNKTVC